MARFKYLGEGHTMVVTVKGGAKQKVREGEIIESDLDPKYFLKNRFEIVTGTKKIDVTSEDD